MAERPNWCLQCELEGISPLGDYGACPLHPNVNVAALKPQIDALRESKVPDDHPWKKH